MRIIRLMPCLLANKVGGKKAPLLGDEGMSPAYLIAPTVKRTYRVEYIPSYWRVSADRDDHDVRELHVLLYILLLYILQCTNCTYILYTKWSTRVPNLVPDRILPNLVPDRILPTGYTQITIPCY